MVAGEKPYSNVRFNQKHADIMVINGELMDSSTNRPFSEAEGRSLYKFASELPEGQVIVCAGSGEAIFWLAKGSMNGQKNSIYYINSCNLNTVADEDDETAQAEFFDDLARNEIPHSIIIPTSTSIAAARKCGKKVGFLWINGDNSYDFIKGTLLTWLPKLASNSKVAFHRCDLPAPSKVLNEHLGVLGDFTLYTSIDTTIIVSIDKCVHHWIIDSLEIGVCKYCHRKRNFKSIRNGIKDIETTKRGNRSRKSGQIRSHHQ